ncbi:MAG: glycoside hydrolase family 130 protein [Flavisolibacter sp.]
MKYCLLIFCIIIFSCNSSEQNNTSANTEDDWTLTPFVKQDQVNPIMIRDSSLVFTDPILKQPVQWARKDVFNPAAVIRNDTVFLIFRAEDTIGKHAGTSRIGLAWSVDGLHFNKFPSPILYPDNDDQKKWEWEGGCEDPRVVEDEKGVYYMTYTAYDGDKARLFIASSPDLVHWTKHGSAFQKSFDGKYVAKWSKSGSIVSSYDNGSPVAKKINGKYWMYWGDVNIWAATSDDLINWTPVLYENGEKPNIELRHNSVEIPEIKIVLGPRNKKFDSDLIEPGPPAMITDKGILLIYNSRNVPSIGDSSLPEGTYAASQVLLDKNDPMKVINRMENHFIKPEKDYEISGQVNHVCFLEGLVKLKKKWFMYYGTADSKIAVAVK